MGSNPTLPKRCLGGGGGSNGQMKWLGWAGRGGGGGGGVARVVGMNPSQKSPLKSLLQMAGVGAPIGRKSKALEYRPAHQFWGKTGMKDCQNVRGSFLEPSPWR